MDWHAQPEARVSVRLANQLELLAPQPFRRIALPACVPPPFRVVGPEPSDNPTIQLVKERPDMRAAKVFSPSSDHRVDRFDQLTHAQRRAPLRQGP